MGEHFVILILHIFGKEISFAEEISKTLATMTITIPDELVEQAHLSPTEPRTDLATYLYGRGRLTMGQVRQLVGLDLISFQHELAKRDISIQFGIADLDKDLTNLNLL